jgi:manganese efflux pump family protein
MSIFTSLLLAIGLAMDAFAVAVARGSCSTAKHFCWTFALKLAVIFGFFQGFMPVIGWAVGHNFKDQIQAFDHWLAFALLAVIGGKMIYDDLKTEEETEDINAAKSDGLFPLLILAVATSIDALAVGFSLSFLDAIMTPVLTIGIVTFAISLVGVWLGYRFRHFGRSKAKLVGGLILIGIGTKILIEHLSLN